MSQSAQPRAAESCATDSQVFTSGESTSSVGIFIIKMIERPLLKFKPSCTCMIKDVSTQRSVNRKFIEGVKSRSKTNIVHSYKLLSILTLKSQSSPLPHVSNLPAILNKVFIVQRKPRGVKKLHLQ